MPGPGKEPHRGYLAVIIPEHWAEASARHRQRGKQVTVRRFGWSNESESDAQAMAEQRAAEALASLLLGEKLARRELKVPYNGAEGVPIREQVIERHGETVITRNLYGARCLNTPGALFADIDFESAPVPAFAMQVIGALAILGLVVGRAASGWGLAVVLMFVGLLAGFSVAKGLLALRNRVAGGPEKLARKRIEAFLQTHPDWHLRLYRTPAGFRLLAMHRAFDPHEPEVAEFFDAIRADPMYVQMCLRQRCFRARLSAKPWRIGLGHIKPRPGVWPINPIYLPERDRWIREYEGKAEGFAACRFVEGVGSGRVDAGVERVRELHDIACKAMSNLPIA